VTLVKKCSTSWIEIKLKQNEIVKDVCETPLNKSIDHNLTARAISPLDISGEKTYPAFSISPTPISNTVKIAAKVKDYKPV